MAYCIEKSIFFSPWTLVPETVSGEAGWAKDKDAPPGPAVQTMYYH
jgi:hypothetical protein